MAFFGATEQGNFEGANVLEGRGPVPDRLREIQDALLGARAARASPGARRQAPDLVERPDDLGARARPARCWSVPDYVAAAVACAEFLLGDLRDPAGRLLRTFKDGRAHIDAYLEDHAYLLEALLTLYEATFDPRWYARGAWRWPTR